MYTMNAKLNSLLLFIHLFILLLQSHLLLRREAMWGEETWALRIVTAGIRNPDPLITMAVSDAFTR